MSNAHLNLSRGHYAAMATQWRDENLFGLKRLANISLHKLNVSIGGSSSSSSASHFISDCCLVFVKSLQTLHAFWLIGCRLLDFILLRVVGPHFLLHHNFMSTHSSATTDYLWMWTRCIAKPVALCFQCLQCLWKRKTSFSWCLVNSLCLLWQWMISCIIQLERAQFGGPE